MATRLRLQRKGTKNKPFYFIVAADSRAPRDGKIIEKLGTYNPLTVPATIHLDRKKVLDWLQKGATMSDTIKRILSFKGILYLKHLLRGVSMGLFDENVAMSKFQKWVEEHELKVSKKKEEYMEQQKKKRDRIYKETVSNKSDTVTV